MPRRYIQNNEIVENIQITFVILYKKPLAKDRLFAYNKDKKQKGDGVAMLKLHTLAAWMHGFLDPDRPYGLPEEMYNDVIPSGVHGYNHTDLF